MSMPCSCLVVQLQFLRFQVLSDSPPFNDSKWWIFLSTIKQNHLELTIEGSTFWKRFVITLKQYTPSISYIKLLPPKQNKRELSKFPRIKHVLRTLHFMKQYHKRTFEQKSYKNKLWFPANVDHDPQICERAHSTLSPFISSSKFIAIEFRHSLGLMRITLMELESSHHYTRFHDLKELWNVKNDYQYVFRDWCINYHWPLGIPQSIWHRLAKHGRIMRLTIMII